MNILLISQCSKRALTETRRILDQFAERRGDRTWQSPMTMQGLDTLRRLLKKTARRNTAVACHWIRGQNHSELMWIVGNANQFNVQGAVPTNITARDILKVQDENDWHTAEEIKLLARMAALWHDFGKANSAFQTKLTKGLATSDAYRHEWVSLRLFEAYVKSFANPQDDQPWLDGLAQIAAEGTNKSWLNILVQDGIKGGGNPFHKMPPLAQAIGWLIVSHHRLPIDKNQARAEALFRDLPASLSADWSGTHPKASKQDIEKCWKFSKGIPFTSRTWQKQASQCAVKMLARPVLLTENQLENPYALHLARMVLMLADHHYSSLSLHESNAIQGDYDHALYANSTKNEQGERVTKQKLDQHLIGVGEHARKIMGCIPRLSHDLPRLARHKGFRRRGKDPRFRWQDQAFDVAESLQAASHEQGFFGINMASTGCGKTLANGRIMYALSHPKLGARFSIALGLRTLTLQTGEAYRRLLGLGDDDLAVLVGGQAVTDLSALNQREKERLESSLSQSGSESMEALLSSDSYVHYESSLSEGSLHQWLKKNPSAQKLLDAPILTCTIDHLMPASESTRGGHQIAPMLRLMTSDLVLDEPDDFSLEDLPALSRLVYWAGLLGSRVLLSSATLPPGLIHGLYDAYVAGRRIYRKNHSTDQRELPVCCAWFDEFDSQAALPSDTTAFMAKHQSFVEHRLSQLSCAQDVRRTAMIATLPAMDRSNPKKQPIESQFADALYPLICQLHEENHEQDKITQKKVSFGLIRMANINPLIDVTRALVERGVDGQQRLHICTYHSRHPLLVRSAIEDTLDRLLNRSDSDALFQQPEVRAALDHYPEQHHIWLVCASPVAEVGRDHDYNWAIVEPSSMRSIIQLAGRIRRHRPEAYSKTNLYLLNTNFKALQQTTHGPIFTKPGFEGGGYILASHDLNHILRPEEWQRLDASPRIQAQPILAPREKLVDLEHQRLQDLMLHTDDSRVLSVPYFWRTPAHLSSVLQYHQPFRAGRPQIRINLMPNEDEDGWNYVHFNDEGARVPNDALFGVLSFTVGERICFWGSADYLTALALLAEKLELSIEDCARRFGEVSLDDDPDEPAHWLYAPEFGFRRRSFQ